MKNLIQALHKVVAVNIEDITKDDLQKQVNSFNKFMNQVPEKISVLPKLLDGATSGEVLSFGPFAYKVGQGFSFKGQSGEQIDAVELELVGLKDHSTESWM